MLLAALVVLVHVLFVAVGAISAAATVYVMRGL